MAAPKISSRLSFAARIERVTGMRSWSGRPSLCRMAVPVRQLWHPVSAIVSVVIFFWPIAELLVVLAARLHCQPDERLWLGPASDPFV